MRVTFTRMFVVVSTCLLFATHIHSAEAANRDSAYRAPDQDWHRAASKLLQTSFRNKETIYGEAIAWDSTTLATQQKWLASLPTWPNYKTIQAEFERLRDFRFLNDPMNLSTKRAIPWHYPIDYCFERAAAAVSLYNDGELAKPAKVFAFGNLALYSPFSPEKNGLLSFWYHVAPIVRDRETNNVYVLDPALNPNNPLALNSWLKQLVQVSKDRELKVNICHGYASTPGEICASATVQDEKERVDNVITKLPSEWDNLQAKGIYSDQMLTDDNLRSLNGKLIYGTFYMLRDWSTTFNDQLLFQYKSPNETHWKTILDIEKTYKEIDKYDYDANINVIPIGSIFGKPSRDKNCVCNYHACECALPKDENKIDLRVVINGNTVKECTYQYPNTNDIASKSYGPDIHYQYDGVNKNYSGTIEGCVDKS